MSGEGGDPERQVGVLLLGASALSHEGFVQIIQGATRTGWRVFVRYQETQHKATSQRSLEEALSRAHQWLAACWARKAAMVSVLLFLLLPVSAWAAGPILRTINGLSWTAPTTNVDGTPLTDFAGFEVLIASTPGITPTMPGVVIRDVGALGVPATPLPNTTSRVTFGSLAPALTDGQKYAVVRAYDLAGNRGPTSNEVPFVYDTVSPGGSTGLGTF